MTADNVKPAAFHDCINADDKHLLLDERKWPAYVVICECFFKAKKHKTPMLLLIKRRKDVLMMAMTAKRLSSRRTEMASSRRDL